MDRALFLIKKLIPRKIFFALQPAYHYILSWLSAVLNFFPSEKLIVIGVTGTTGKTTTVYLIAKMLAETGCRVGFTSTAMFSDGLKEWLNDKKMTMVGRFFIQKILRQMVKNGCQYAIVETSSEGIRQFRHRFINYDILVFTCLYPEHIESHGSFENYQAAKGKLFAHLKNCATKHVDDCKQVKKTDSGLKKITLHRIKKTIIANGDDQYAGYFLNFWAEEKIELRIRNQEPGTKKKKKDKKIKNIEALFIKTDSKKTIFKIDEAEISLNLLGRFNIANALSAVAVGQSQGVALSTIKKGLESVKGVPGRLEKIEEGQNFTIIVDYAFEPNALAKLYQIAEKIEHQNIIHVLGSAGGGRDVARRPKLGELAGQKANQVIITDEDPYDDDPLAIINQVSLGAEKSGKKLNQNLFRILDRRQAIKKALEIAGEGDLVLITGKGSEQAICTANGKKIPWDDREVIRQELRNKK